MNLTDQFSLVDGDAIPPFRAAVRWNFTAGQFGSVKTGNRNRTVPLPQMVVDASRRLQGESAFSRPDDPVFTSRNGTPVDANNVRNRAFKTCRREAWIPCELACLQAHCGDLGGISRYGDV